MNSSQTFKPNIRDDPRWGTGLLAVAAAGWLLAALWVVPWVRDFMVTGIATGSSPSITSAWPPPAPIIIGAAAAFVLFAVGLVTFIVWCGRRGGLDSIVEDQFSTPGRLALAISIWTAVISAALLARGDPIIGDAKTHIARAWIWKESLKAGGIPVWTDLWYGGFPIDQHYSPLSHVLAALLSLTGISPFLAVKLIVWLSGIIGAVGFGMWCQSYFRSQQAGLLGGILYSLVPVLDAAWMWYGRLPGVLIISILPWAFYAVNKLADRSGGRRAASMLALCIAALTLTHVLQARLAFAILAVYSVGELVLRRDARPGWLLFGWCGGLAMSLLFVIPIYLERDFVNNISVQPFAIFSILPFLPQLARYAVRWNPRGVWYLGLTVLILSALGLWNLVRAAVRDIRSIRVMLTVMALILVPWIFAYGQAREEELLFYGIIVAAAASAANSKFWRRSYVMLIAMAIILIDLGPANLISTYVAGRDEKETAYEWIESSIGSGRYLELPLDSDGRPRSSYWHYIPTREVASLGGPFIQGAPRSFINRAALVDTVAFALAGGSGLSRRLVGLMEIENVRLISFSTATTITVPSSPIPDGVMVDTYIPAWTIQNASPVSVIDSLPAYSVMEAPTVKMPGIGDSGDGSRSVSRNVIENVIYWMETMDPVPVVGVELNRRLNAVDLLVPSVGRKTLRIALESYPTMKVYVDGTLSEWRVGPLGGILVDVAPGSHAVSIEVGMMRTRMIMNILLLVIMIGFLISAIVPHALQFS
jgi:hypothetical protein